MKKELTPEERKASYNMHKDFYDKISLAIDNGFFFDAYIREYNAMEARMSVIMSIIRRPCELCDVEKLKHNVGISTKFKCLKKVLQENEQISNKTKLDNQFFRQISSWLTIRNQLVHGLYSNPADYEKLSRKSKEYAIKGKEFVRKIYNEAERLKKLQKNKPEMFMKIKTECYVNPDTFEHQDDCKPLIEYLNNADAQL